MSGLNVLLLSDDEAWLRAATAATQAVGAAPPTTAGDPARALRALLSASGGYTHLLLDTRTAPDWQAVFAGLTVDETESGTALVWLGDASGQAGSADFVATPDAKRLARLLAAPARPPTGPQAPLSGGDVSSAIQEGRVSCRFQPIVRLADRRPMGFEALARLYHPVRGMLPPGKFIPQVEQAGLSLQLTEAVFGGFLSQMNAAFLQEHDLFVSINLPLDAFLLPEALARIETLRVQAGVPAARVLIEMTESRPVYDLATLAAALDRWRRVGYRVAIDDLGPDVMNQSSLIDMAFDAVKLDRRIVLRSCSDGLAHRYLQRTVADAQAHALTVIAEGIEDAAVWDGMAAMGVEQGQGFMIARALPAAVLPTWLEVWNGQSPAT